MENPWQFREIDSSLFKAFLFAARELNFTRAAQLAGMTQSGVSQKISRLEEQIGHPLFLRVNKSISLTESGRIMLDYIEKQQDDLEQLFENLGYNTASLSGLVRYGMPHSCLFTPHFPILLKARKAFPKIFLKVDLCSNETVIEKVLDRELDFGFVTRKSNNPAIEQELFAAEEYALVGGKYFKSEKLEANADFIRNLPFVNYPGMRNLFDIWRLNHYPKSRTLNFESLLMAGDINSLHAAVTMITHGLGWSVVPLHVVDRELKRNEIQVYPGTENKHSISEIFIVYLKGARLPARVRAIIKEFEKMKKPGN